MMVLNKYTQLFTFRMDTLNHIRYGFDESPQNLTEKSLDVFKLENELTICQKNTNVQMNFVFSKIAELQRH